jgi:hypothetical protein
VIDKLFDLESAIRKTAIEVRSVYARRLADLGLDAKIGLRKSFQNGAWNIELQINFMRGVDLIDALEGFVIKDGRLAVSDDELRSWLHDNMQDVVERRSSP